MTIGIEPPKEYAVDPEERIDLLLRHLDTRREGLRGREAGDRLAQFGRNEITRRAGPGRLRELGRQFSHPLALLLWAAAALALLGGIPALAVAIVVVIVLNAVFAFAQEMQAERATEALQEFLPPLARVRRDGRLQEVPASELVPGDMLRLEEGDRLSADARLVQGSLELDMSPLTGESQPVGTALSAGPPGHRHCLRPRTSSSVARSAPRSSGPTAGCERAIRPRARCSWQPRSSGRTWRSLRPSVSGGGCVPTTSTPGSSA